MVRVKKIVDKVKQTYDFIDENVDVSLDDEITTGLVPFGDTGLYTSPDEPASPTDCDRYPDSPFCGSNPFTKEPIGLDPEVIINQCDTGIKFSPVLGFVKLPPVYIVYRHPACRTVKPKPIVITDDDVQIDTDSGFYYGYYSGLGNFIYRTQAKQVKRIISVNKIGIPEYILQHRDRLEIIGQTYRYIYYEDFNVEGEHFYQHWEIFYEDCFGNILPFYNIDYYLQDGIPTSSFRMPVAYQTIEREGYSVRKRLPPIVRDPDSSAPCPVQILPPPPPKDKECCMTCCDDSLLRILLKKVNRLSEVVAVDSYPGKLVKTKPDEKGKLQPTEIEIKDLRELVGQVYSDLEKTSKAIGIDDYPVKLPKSLIEKYSGGGGAFSDALAALDEIHDATNPDGTISTTKEVPSLTQMFAWYIERFDEIVGQFEIPIEIKDTDVLKDGDQPATIRLPNIAESIAELFMLAFQAQMNTEILINMVTRVMLEGGQDKQQNFISYHLLLTIVDWIGFKTKDVKKDMNLLFTPGKNRLDELLDESKQSVIVQELDEKFGLEVDMMRFRKAASILDSVFFRKVNPDGNIKAQIMGYLLDSLSTSKRLNSSEKNDSDSSFRQFLDEAETGFIHKTGVTDNQHPYGRDYFSRPRIKDLSENQGDNNSGNA